MINSINSIVDSVASKNRRLSELLARIFKDLQEISTEVETIRLDHKDFEEQINNRKGRSLTKDLDDVIDEIADSIQSINIIPGLSGDCHELCISKAFDKWSSKNGFKGIANKTISYWLACTQINKDTLIFTTAWDEIDFIQKYKQHFDAQSRSQNKTVCVILATSNSFSIQYLR